MERKTFLRALGTGVAGSLIHAALINPIVAADRRPPGGWVMPRPNYKCLYNIESLMHCNNDISSPKVKWVVEKLTRTDVDAIMCCPTAWRTNLFPSEVDPEWKKFTHIRDIPDFEPFDYVMKYIHDGGDPVRHTRGHARDRGGLLHLLPAERLAQHPRY